MAVNHEQASENQMPIEIDGVRVPNGFSTANNNAGSGHLPGKSPVITFLLLKYLSMIRMGEAIVELSGETLEAGVSVIGGTASGTVEVAVNDIDALVPGDGIPFVDLNLPEAPGWWPGGGQKVARDAGT